MIKLSSSYGINRTKKGVKKRTEIYVTYHNIHSNKPVSGMTFVQSARNGRKRGGYMMSQTEAK